MPAQTLKRGATPSPRSALAAARPHRATVGAPPNFLTKPARISMWGNDVHGDCVTAEEAFAKACNDPEVFVSDDTVIAWATRHGVLEGAYLTQVMGWMQNDGFADDPYVYDDGPYFSVDWTNAGTLRSAISAGPVKLGVAADQIENAYWTNGGHTGWFGTGFHADGNEDHCVALCGYGAISWLAQQLGVSVPAGVDGTQPGYALFTWNSIGIIDVPSMVNVTHEAWLRQPTTVTKGGPPAPVATAVSLSTDLTGDGRADVAGFGEAGMYVALNNGNGTFQPLQLAINNFGYTAGGWRVEKHPRVLADLTGDGRADVAGFGEAGMYVALNNGNGTFQPLQLAINNFGYTAGGWRVEKHPRVLADLTGDGRADVAGFGEAGMYVALNNGNGTFQPLQLAINNFGYTAGGWRVEKHPRFLVDLTGDGRADVVGFGEAGMYVALNNGNGTFQPLQLAINNFGYTAGGWRVEKHPRFLVDLTGDGRADVVGFGEAGMYVALNNGNGTFQPLQLAINNFGYTAGGWRVEKHPRFLVDLTGDGRADVVGFGEAGMYVALNNGNGTFQPLQLAIDNFGYTAGGWRVEKHPRFLADFTGDGAVDTAGFGEAGMYVALNKGNGTFLPLNLAINNFGYSAGGWRVEKHPRLVAGRGAMGD